MPVLKIIRGLFFSPGFNFKFKSLLSTAASCCRLQNGMRAARGDAGKTNELVVSLNVFISQPADKQSPGARQPPTSHPYRQLRTLNKEGHFEGGTLQRGGDTPGDHCTTRETLSGEFHAWLGESINVFRSVQMKKNIVRGTTDPGYRV